MHECLSFLISSLKKDVERPSTFIAVGEVAVVIGKQIVPYIEQIVSNIKSGNFLIFLLEYNFWEMLLKIDLK